MKKIFVLLGEDEYESVAKVDGVFFNENDLFERIKYIISYREDNHYARYYEQGYSDIYTVHVTNGDKIENIMEINLYRKKMLFIFAWM